MPAELRSERRGATLVLTLSDPATRNRLSDQLVAAGIEALSVAESDPSVRCVVLRGEGADFCAGSAPGAPAPTAAESVAAALRRAEQFAQLAEAIRACPKPVIAAVEGMVAGAGLALVLACDLAVAAENARFMRPQDRLAAGPDGAAAALFAQALPRPLALRWLWLDEAGFAHHWQACGGLTSVCASGQALHEGCMIAERLARVPAEWLAADKELVDRVPHFGQRLAAARIKSAAGQLRG
jgi:enoyl-CoA hydratase/carnithine racemase